MCIRDRDDVPLVSEGVRMDSGVMDPKWPPELNHHTGWRIMLGKLNI